MVTIVVSEDVLSCAISDEGDKSGVDAAVVLGEGVWGWLRMGVGGTTTNEGDCIEPNWAAMGVDELVSLFVARSSDDGDKDGGKEGKRKREGVSKKRQRECKG